MELPPLTDQKAFVHDLATRLNEVEKVREAAKSELQSVDSLPAALLRQAFSGELRKW